MSSIVTKNQKPVPLIRLLFWVQSYDIFLNAISLAHGNHTNKAELETVINQPITKTNDLYPMELYSRGHGKSTLFCSFIC